MLPKFIFVTFLMLMLPLNTYSLEADLQTPPYIEIYDERALNVLDPEAVFNILGEGYSWSEGPLWLAEQNMLLFSDVPQNIIYQYKESEGVSVYLKPSGATGIHSDDSQQGANGLVLDPEGKLLIMQHGDRRVSVMDAPLDAPMPIYTSVVSHYEDKRLNSPNDGVFHSSGDLYFTDPPYGLSGGRNSPHKQLAFDGIYRLSKAGKLTLEDDSVLYPNGIILSNDESKAFVAASNRADAKWYQYDIAEDGSLANKQVFYDVSDLVGQTKEQGLPDGFAMHTKGYLFATGPGGVFLFTESGELLAKIRTGKSTANCALSADQKTLFMTAHDTLMSIQLK
ncbi:SMP-30/gluconolactonase/LRE family protein [Glaciecola sp. SC05]|uniref:SMP-30/gluconolactonase/LRE family protein n=1 Tax=Glaciecola sp. SC05 TaxID=1987355 RepID=UPI003529C0DE